jgi:hypothetical protein
MEKIVDVNCPNSIMQDWELDWELRNAFCIQIPLVCAFLGPSVTSECILPFLEKARLDAHERVVASAVRCIWSLIEMSLLSKPLVVDTIAKTAALLIHPSTAVRENAIGMTAAAAQFIGVTDSYVFLLPHIRPVLTCDLIGLEITSKSLSLALCTAIDRKLYQKTIRQWPQPGSTNSKPYVFAGSPSKEVKQSENEVSMSAVVVDFGELEGAKDEAVVFFNNEADLRKRAKTETEPTSTARVALQRSMTVARIGTSQSISMFSSSSLPLHRFHFR